jgi:hypothetical protein
MSAGGGGAAGSVGDEVGGSGILRSCPGIGAGGRGIAGKGNSHVLSTEEPGDPELQDARVHIGARGIDIAVTPSSRGGTAGSAKTGLIGFRSGASTRSSSSAPESGDVGIDGAPWGAAGGSGWYNG